jgi:aryl-alcohol dehydrogenase-like predicted oxidoreductase
LADHEGPGLSQKNIWARFASVQAYYTLAGRDLEREIVPLLQDQGLGLMVWSPLAGGLLSGKFGPDGQAPDGARRASFDFPVVDKPRALRCVEPCARSRSATMPRSRAWRWLGC